MFDNGSVNRTFKIGMRAKWENWMSCGEKSFTATGRLRRATLAEVAPLAKSVMSKKNN
jgi:hypothetical protein